MKRVVLFYVHFDFCPFLAEPLFEPDGVAAGDEALLDAGEIESKSGYAVEDGRRGQRACSAGKRCKVDANRVAHSSRLMSCFLHSSAWQQRAHWIGQPCPC